jgi:hypothetical protein
MRNMAFSMTTPQMYAEIKDLTHRIGWWNLKPGDVLMAVEKGMGLKKGERVVRIYPIEIISTRPEPIGDISQQDVVWEGFPDKSVEWFIDFFCRGHKCTPDTITNRIKFRKARA